MELLQVIESSAFLRAFGVASTVYLLLKLAYGFYSFASVYLTKSELDFTKFGKWALVTGAGDGIGKNFAIELARRGINVVLVSLYQEELDQVTDLIRSKYKVQTRCVQFDFTKTDDLPTNDVTSSVYDVITTAVDDLEIGILVNNVGTGSMGEFLQTCDVTKVRGAPPGDVIKCNVIGTLKMTQLFAEKMVKRRNGLVINISSATAALNASMVAAYAGTKRVVDTFSKSVSYEYKKNGVVFQTIKPGKVATKTTSGLGDAVPPDVFVQHALRTVGKANSTFGYWRHAVRIWVGCQLSDETIYRRTRELAKLSGEKKR